MDDILDRILSYPQNEMVLNFLNIEPDGNNLLTPYTSEKKSFNEGLNHFMEIGISNNMKYMIDGNGVFIIPSTGEIIAFQFGRFEIAFKVLDPNVYKANYSHIKRGLIGNLKLRLSRKVSLRFFTNIYGDDNTFIDISDLDSNWALSIYFVDEVEALIQNYVSNCLSK
jgi:hypothetical protein